VGLYSRKYQPKETRSNEEELAQKAQGRARAHLEKKLEREVLPKAQRLPPSSIPQHPKQEDGAHTRLKEVHI